MPSEVSHLCFTLMHWEFVSSSSSSSSSNSIFRAYHRSLVFHHLSRCILSSVLYPLANIAIWDPVDCTESTGSRFQPRDCWSDPIRGAYLNKHVYHETTICSISSIQHFTLCCQGIISTVSECSVWLKPHSIWFHPSPYYCFLSHFSRHLPGHRQHLEELEELEMVRQSPHALSPKCIRDLIMWWYTGAPPPPATTVWVTITQAGGVVVTVPSLYTQTFRSPPPLVALKSGQIGLGQWATEAKVTARDVPEKPKRTAAPEV